MKLHVCAVGQRMPGWVQAAWDDYARRMPRDCPLVLHEIRPESRALGKTPGQLMRAEALRIEAALPDGALRIILDEHGKALDTMQLAQLVQQWRDSGTDAAFVIGGPDGLDAGLKRSAHQTLRLSSLTLPHPMVRILLAEQLYRAWSILTGHPYHRS
ncbi:23S rRNA (pseudouridine(1915)-N(3))-methyltransferase RlmH [Castellaniella sp.]|uniref:23S rRNA (pseudouridine(1915)-N(3))-methyltransferase RlmH n=1 Tax=Castellaniella sp. TaxID=1955812 RepID=UPI00355FADFA